MIGTRTEEYILKGKVTYVTVYSIAEHEIITTGELLKIARVKEEWDDDVIDPDQLASTIKKEEIKADIFTFQQRLPDSRPKFNYCMEWDNVAAIPISTYDTWYLSQLHSNHRNKLKIAKKKGVVVKSVVFNDDMAKGIQQIYNESPIRQGRPYWNFGMDFDLTKKENSTFSDRAVFIGAYHKDELIGYIRLVFTDRYARTMGILSMIKHRNKAPNNALIAKAVEICAERKVPYLVYAKYDYGKLGSDSLMDFKKYNGFESIMLPRYYIPLTMKGKIALSCNLHHGVVGILPQKIVRGLRSLRNRWYTKTQ